MIKIICEKTQYHKFAFVFDFDMTVLTFCRQIKATFPRGTLSFYDGRWRFSDMSIAWMIKTQFPETDIEDKIVQPMLRYKIEKDKEKVKTQMAEEIKTKDKSAIERIPGVKLPLYEFQKIGVEFFDNNDGNAILADQMGCIAENSIVIINRGGNAKRYDMKTIYERFNNLDAKTKWLLPSYTRSYDEISGMFKLNKIKNVLFKGKKNVVKLTAKNTSGKKYEIELTADHKVLLEKNKWIKSGKLKKGDRIVVNGKKTKFCPTCKKNTEFVSYEYSKFYGICKKCVYRYYRNNHPNKNYISLDKDGYVLVGGLYYHPNFKNVGNNGVREHVLSVEANLNGFTLEQWVKMHRENNVPKKMKYIDTKKFAVHHIDGNKQNNKIKNLKILTHQEHAKLESVKNIKNLKFNIVPDIATVVSVKKTWSKNVYDIVMDDPYRNFIANGIVVHNCGKTAQSLAYAAYKKFEKVLIICPASVKYNWANETTKWTHFSSVVLKSDMIKKESDKSAVYEMIRKNDVVIINYDSLKKFLDILCSIRFDCLITDEFHMIKSNTAQRTKYVKEIAKRIPRKLLLSGTPLLSRPSELYNGLYLMDPVTWSNWYSYTKKYCGGSQTRWGYDFSGATNIDELRAKIGRYFLRRTKEEVLKELPPKQFTDIPVELGAEARFKYDLALEDFKSYLADVKKKRSDEIARSMAAESLVRLNELRTITTQGKIDAAVELIQNIIDGGEKVLVFSNFNEPLEFMNRKFGDKSFLLTGKTDEFMRQKMVEDFQSNPEKKIFFGGMKSAGVGITLTAANNVVFLDYSWVPADHLQAMDRAHRIGNKAQSISVYQLYATDTIDQQMAETLKEKQAVFDKLFNSTNVSEEVEKINLFDAVMQKINKTI